MYKTESNEAEENGKIKLKILKINFLIKKKIVFHLHQSVIKI